MEAAIKYVRENIELEELDRAREEAFYYRKPIRLVNAELYEDIVDLLEEYGEDNDLPEGWWMEEVDIDDDIIRWL